jgi:histidyl-tRNA synthetase
MFEFNRLWEEYNALCRTYAEVGVQRIDQVVYEANARLKILVQGIQNPWYYDAPRGILRPVLGADGIRVYEDGTEKEVFFFDAFGWTTRTRCHELHQTTRRILITTHAGLLKYQDHYQAQAAILRKTYITWEIFTQERSLGIQISYAERRGFSVVSISREENILNGTVLMRDLKSGNQIEVPVAVMLNVFPRIDSTC